jgi:RNA polymerase sigma factor (sigma-70 family)
MADEQLGTVLRHVRQLAGSLAARGQPDRHLLARFAIGRDEDAFAELMRRHGPLVLAVCRRVLGHAQDAEDAFQATFLVLARKAASIRKGEAVGSWLYGVAYRIAMKEKANIARRRLRERRPGPSRVSGPAYEAAWRDLQRVLDEELNRLPEKYRAPFVLCCLEGKSKPEAASELGWKEGTVSSRLAQAREQLQERLSKRGVTLSAVLVAAGLSGNMATAAVPTLLAACSVKAAAAFASNPSVVAGWASAKAVRLAVLMLQAMTMTPVKVATALLAVACLVATGVGLARQAPAAGQPGAPPAKGQEKEPRGAPRPQPDPKEEVRTDRYGDLLPAEAVARMGSGRMRHMASRLAFSPDGRWLASGGMGLRLWDATTGKLQQRFDVDTDWYTAFAFSADGIALAGAGRHDPVVTAQVVDPANGKPRGPAKNLGRHTGWPLTFAPGGKRLALTQKSTVQLYDPATGEEAPRIPVPGFWPTDVAFAPDGKTLAICGDTDRIRIHDATNGKTVRELKRDGDRGWLRLFFSPDGRYLAAIPLDDKKEFGEASIWDLATGKERHRLKSPAGLVLCVGFSPDASYVATGCQHTDLVLWDMATGREVRRFPTNGFFGSVVFSPDGMTVAAVSGEGAIRLWEVATGRVRPASADPLINAVDDLRFGTGGKALLGSTGFYIAWDPTTGQEVRRFPQVPARSWSRPLSPDESLLAGADLDGSIRLWDGATGKEVRRLKGHETWLVGLVFSPDGRRLFSKGADGSIHVWDVATGRQLHRLTGQNGTMCLVASPDGRLLAVGGDIRGPHDVILLDLSTGREKIRFTMPGRNVPGSLAFSADGRLLVAAGQGRRDEPSAVKVWDVIGRQERYSFDGGPKGVWSVAFSGDGRTLATGANDGTLSLWELAGGKQRHQFKGHECGIRSLAFSPDGRLLAASSGEAPVYVWDVAGLLQQARSKPSAAELERCWTDLAGVDAAAAFRAVRLLAAAPGPAQSILRDRLMPVEPADPQRVRRLLQDLDSSSFAVRDKATAELGQLADRAVPVLQRALAAAPALEIRRRLEQVLSRLEAGTPEALRAMRAVEALEWMATPEARRLLTELAAGAPGARLTEEAKASLARLPKRPAP